ncbi:MAG: nitroreductase family protein [Dehalococcoidales bacterium]|nr:nitroreductase family protein [Dehalococcoidales bacterium]
MDIFQAIEERRSIRKYKPDPVDDATLEKVLDAARLAPSWKNSQCWRFIVVRDAGTKAAVADCMIGVKSYENGGKNALKQAPVMIVACAEHGKAGMNEGGFATSKGDWFMYDTALAMQNLVLAAHALGLGTVHLGLFDAEKVTEILGIPEGFSVVAITPLGYPDETPNPVPRKPLSEIVTWEKFKI